MKVTFVSNENESRSQRKLLLFGRYKFVFTDQCNLTFSYWNRPSFLRSRWLLAWSSESLSRGKSARPG